MDIAKLILCVPKELAINTNRPNVPSISVEPTTSTNQLRRSTRQRRPTKTDDYEEGSISRTNRSINLPCARKRSITSSSQDSRQQDTRPMTKSPRKRQKSRDEAHKSTVIHTGDTTEEEEDLSDDEPLNVPLDARDCIAAELLTQLKTVYRRPKRSKSWSVEEMSAAKAMLELSHCPRRFNLSLFADLCSRQERL